MKKLVLLFLTLILGLQSKAQIVFCPPGAEWHYLFSGSHFFPGNAYNETIKYTSDSIVGQDTLKLLKHYRFYTTCGAHTNFTFLKQKGDTVFIKNQFTQNSWQVLYNFATPPNQSWQCTVLSKNSLPKTFSYTVQAVEMVTINNVALKQMTVTTSHWGGTIITERFGSNVFLFDFLFMEVGQCDADMWMEFLCYQDNLFGVKQFTEKSCDYRASNSVGITERGDDKSGIVIYPNPVMSELTVELDFIESAQLTLTDVYGKELMKMDCKNRARIDVSDLKNGLYLLIIKQKDNVIATTKFIKE